ncbi:GtrA family protein [Stenotrophomonas sp.]|uniref:GtrA family protein n=1 Tax=Stenotrophomonas sp. TaxID=69392 RepID=UPI0028ACA0BA|nr:GtrA family protein [Stenotrophomonas sp.]
MKHLSGRIFAHDLFRYFVASVIALAIDVAVLSVAMRLFNAPMGWAATLGFASGAVVAYALSTRWVFKARSLAAAPLIEFAVFAIIGIVGLGVTQFVLWLGVVKLGLLPELVKLAAAGATFVFNYLARRSLLFVSRSRIIVAGEDLV